MSENIYIPFDIQVDIIQRLPTKSLVRFQCVSKQWKSLINSTKFINYHRKQSQRHLLVRQELYGQNPEYTSIIVDDTFPNQKSSVPLPPPLSLMNDLELVNSVNGLLCFYGRTESNTCMIVLWNPTIRKTVSIPITKNHNAVFGFGFCQDSSDPKLVKIIIRDVRYDWEIPYWKVGVFTLSSRIWKTLYKGRPPIAGCLLLRNHVCIDGIIYWLATYRNDEDGIVSFDLRNEEFGQVCLPHSLSLTHVAEVNGSLVVVENNYCYLSIVVYGLWMMESVTKSFAKMFNVHLCGHNLRGVIWFRKNDEVIIEVVDQFDENMSRLEVYPSSGCTRISIKINRMCYYGRQRRVSLYLETLLLLDEPSSIISLPPKKKTSSIIP